MADHPRGGRGGPQDPQTPPPKSFPRGQLSLPGRSGQGAAQESRHPGERGQGSGQHARGGGQGDQDSPAIRVPASQSSGCGQRSEL